MTKWKANCPNLWGVNYYDRDSGDGYNNYAIAGGSHTVPVCTDPYSLAAFDGFAVTSNPTAINVPGATFGSSTTFTVPNVALAAKPTVISVVSAHAATATTPTIADTHSTTWTQVATVQSNTSSVRRRETVFVGYPAAGTQSIVVAFGGVTQDGGSVQTSQWNNAHASDLIVQSKTQAGLAFGGVTVAFDAVPRSGGSVFVAAGLNNNVSFAPAAGYVALANTTWTTPVSAAMTAYIAAADQPAHLSITGTTAFQYAAIALEIRAVNGWVTVTGAANVAGAGAILASGLVQPGGATIVTGIANVAGAGAVSATGVRGLTGAANIAGAGAIAVSGSIRGRLGAADLVGDGEIEASGFVTLPPLQGAAQVFGAGAISATGVVPGAIVQASAMLGGAALISATGYVSRPPTMVVGREHDLMGGPIPPTPSSW